MKKVVFIFYSLFFFHSLFSQEAGFDWAGSFGSSTVDEVNSICSDNLGNSYLTGAFISTIDFDFGVGTCEIEPIGGADMFIAKYSNSGEFDWCKHVGNITDVSGYEIYWDETGNVYITGFFSGAVDFDPGADVFELNGGLNGDCFILKLDTDGNFVWAKSFGDGLADFGREITTDGAGNVYTSGTYQGTVDFDPGVGTFNITSNGEQDVFIQKLNSAGDFIWAKSIGGAMEDRVFSINVDDFESVYISGAFEGTIDLDPNAAVFPITSNGLFDGYITKLDDDGSFIWGVQIGGTIQDRVTNSKLDEFGNIYSTGYFFSTVDLDPSDDEFNLTSNGSTDFFIQKLDTDGNLIWAKSIGSTGDDLSHSMAIDVENNVYITGYYSLTVDFDPGVPIFSKTSIGGVDVFIQKINQSGDFVWVKTLGGNGTDEGISIDLNADGDIYLSGNYRLMVDFNPDAGGYNLTSNGANDIFILKLNACSPNATTDVINSCISYTWINGTTYYEDNNSATVTLINMLGCDSVVTLDLTINEVDITTTAVGGVLSSNAPGATYQWLDCNDAYSEIAGATNQTYTPIDDGDYAVKVTIGSCTDTSACIAVDGVGLNDDEELSQIHLYPNPNNGLFNINLGQVQATLIQISSANGTIIYSNSTNLTGIHQIALNISAGLYFVDVWTESGTYQMKLVVE